MTQNTSSAVMQQRKEPPDSFDDFPTPPWATRALVEHGLVGKGYRLDMLKDMTVWEPACNRGFMVRPLQEYFKAVRATDVMDYGYGYGVHDFLMPTKEKKPDFIITNPPFRLAEQFILRALDLSKEGVAMFVRSSFIESVGRYERLFSSPITRPNHFAQFTERVPLFKGRVDHSSATATAYCWLIWNKSTWGRLNSWHTKLIWIPPCRKQLERPGDYELPEHMNAPTP